MNIESFGSANPPPKIEVRQNDINDHLLLREAQNKLNILNSFFETGNMIFDYNRFLEITNRDVNYKKATNESKEDLIKNLETILNSLKEEKEEHLNDSYASESKKIYYQEAPDMEIRILTKLLQFYK